MSRSIYLDHNATTPILPAVADPLAGVLQGTPRLAARLVLTAGICAVTE